MMRIVIEGAGGTRDVAVSVAAPDATVGELLAVAGEQPRGHRGVLIGGRFVDGATALAEAGLYDGAVVRPAAGPVPRCEEPPRGPVLAVVGGLDAGRRHPLAQGRTVIGRDAACDVVLAHATVSARHCAVELAQTGRAFVGDLGSSNGTWIGDLAVDAPVPLADGSVLRLGAVQLMLVTTAHEDRLDLGRAPVDACGRQRFNRPPRASRAALSAAVTLPRQPPDAPAAQPLPWVSVLAPLAFGAVMAAFQPRFALFALLSPVLLLGSWAEGRRRGVRTVQAERTRYRARLRTLRAQLEARRAEAVQHARAAAPDPAEVARRATAPSTRLWERRPGDPDFLVLTAGLGEAAWQPLAEPGEPGALTRELADILEGASRLTDVPVSVELASGGVVGLVGDRSAALALARSLVCQAAVHHGPADLRIAVLTSVEETAAWEWTTWLPQTRGPAGGGRLLANRPGEAGTLLRGLLARERARTPQPDSRAEAGPVVLTVVDAPEQVEGGSAAAVLRGEAGPVAGIVLASGADRLPAVCSTVIDLADGDGAATVSRPRQDGAARPFLAAGLSVETARTCALGLARFEDPEAAGDGSSLPDRVDLVTLLGEDVCDPLTVARRWRRNQAEAGLTVPLGVTAEGVLTLDLVRDGPHGLVGGTTGSGKSELLRSLVAGLALTAGPDRLTFALIDYKGGSAFDDCARLPHTVGMVTDLDAHLGERALRCLEAELAYRERRLRDAGAADLSGYLRLPVAAAQPLPRLLVVIDEFAALAAELGDFVDTLVGIAQRGRSLGMHLLLATQRPSGTVSEAIRANTNLRIALRVQDAADSTDVVGAPDAADIARERPGRAYARLGPGEIFGLQTARVTGATSRAPSRSPEGDPPSRRDHDRIVLAPLRFGPDSPAAPAPPAASGEGAVSDLQRIVAAVQQAFAASGTAAPRRPWPEPLPGDLALEALPLDGAPQGSAGTVTVGLADDPEAQSQHPAGWRPADGNLLLYGLAGAGTTTALAAIALRLAAASTPDDLHLYVLDLDAGALAPLAGLPHTGAVVTAAQGERQRRLVRMLRAELTRRRDATARHGARPRIVLLLDGFSAFRADHEEPALQWVADDLARIVADGPAVEVFTVLTAERAGAVPSALAATIGQRWLFRLADPFEYASFGVRLREPASMPPGRCVVAGSGRSLHVQIARPDPTLAEAVARIAAAATAGQRPPAPVGTLPARVSARSIAAALRIADQVWCLPVGVAESTLAPATLRLYAGEHAVIAGPPRSGRSGLLYALAQMLARRVRLTAVAPRPSPLRGLGAAARLVTERGALPEALREAASAGGPQVVLVDDAEAVDDASGSLGGLIGGLPSAVRLVVAGRADALRACYGHWTGALRGSGAGVLLRPDADLDGDLLGVRLPRRTPVPVAHGRGWLVGDGHADFIQAAGVDDVEAIAP